MERGLVVIEGDESTKGLLHEAGTLAAGVGAELLLLHVTTEEEFEERIDALAAIHNLRVSYDVMQAREGARQFAADIGSTVLDGVDVDYEAIGRLGDDIEEVLSVAEEYECDHLFVSGRKRSPTGKAIFGDRAQALILNFDGPVTVVTA